LDRNKLSAALIGLGSILIVCSIVLMTLVLTGVIGGGTSGNSDLRTVPGFGRIEKPAPPAAVTGPPPSEAPIARLVRGVDGAGVMESPDNAYDTAWYDFSARPGFGGNAVFSGHVDYIRVGQAVFWDLKDLQQGDVIEVRLNDGTTYKYAVSFKQQFDAETAPVSDIVGPTPNETVTLITCGGTFSSATGQYDKRLVVRAERVADTLPPPSGAIAP